MSQSEIDADAVDLAGESLKGGDDDDDMKQNNMTIINGGEQMIHCQKER